MITLMAIITLLGFWCCYQTSTRAALTSGGSLTLWIQQNTARGRFAGLLILSLGLTLGLAYLGIGAGIFAFLVALMTIASLVVLLAPMHLINYRTVGIVLLVSLLLEMGSQ